MRAERLVMKGLIATADRAGVDVIGDEGNHFGPIKLAMDVFDCFGEAWVACEMVIVAGMKDI